MPSTRELVSIIKEDFAPSWGRPKILQYLDWAQRRLMMNDCAQTVYLNEDDDTFPFPILSTTSGTLSYDITSNLVDSDGNSLTPSKGAYTLKLRRVRHVFIAAASLANSNYDKKFYGKQFNLTGLNEYWSQRLYRVSYYAVPGDLRDPDGIDTEPRIIFHEDPGTETSKYYVEAFFDPIQLTSESIPLSCDGDRWEEALVDGVRSRIESAENGRSDLTEKFNVYWVKKFTNYMNDSANQRRPSTMPIRAAG